MPKPRISSKRTAISKANAQMVVVVSIASFIAVFSLVASKAVLTQNSYQSRVTAKKEVAYHQLTTNIVAAKSLVDSYKQFTDKSNNVIGGNTVGQGDKDGDNGKIILDALPSNYDFPALASSLEKILTSQNLKVSSITGTDDQVNQQTNLSSPSPVPVPMPFSFSVTNASYTSIQQLINTLQSSIRPIQIDTIVLSGAADNMQTTITAHTYYQPAKNLKITKELVK
jgi:hypothetical protein